MTRGTGLIACGFFTVVALGAARCAKPAYQPASGSAHPCTEWAVKFDRLSQGERDLLARYGVLLNSGFVLSPQLVPDCTVRIAFETYLNGTILGPPPDTQLQAFVRQHRRTLGSVLEKVWPAIGASPAVKDDGAFRYVKWHLLADSPLASSQVATLLRQSLAKEDLSGPVVWFLFHHPLRDLRTDILRIVRREEDPATRRDRSATTQILGLVLLYSMGERGIGSQLMPLVSACRTTDVERKVIGVVLGRMNDGQPVQWRDIEDLCLDV
jgi:hypothetical protein